MALILAAAMIYLRPYLSEFMDWFGMEQDFSARSILMAAFSGVAIHVMLDVFHHPKMHPFYPLMEKPFYGLMSTGQIRTLACLFTLVSPLLSLRLLGDDSSLVNP